MGSEVSHLEVHGPVVVEVDLEDQLLSTDDEGGKIQGHEEILEHRELTTQGDLC